MAVTFIRMLITFVTLVIVLRLMGKRQIGEMQPFEFVITLIIADLACVPMADVSIPLVYGLVGILGLFVLHQLLSVIEQSGNIPKFILSGKPSIVINKNGVDIKELRKNDMGVEDLIESMRAMGYFSLDDLKYAIFESNGKLSALPADEACGKSGLPIVLINCGKPVEQNLKFINTDKSSVSEYLKGQGECLKNTEVMTVDENGKVYYKAKNRKYRILSYVLPRGVKW